MTDVEFYTRIITAPCEGCDAYENLGHCGTWWSTCVIPKFHNFLREMHWDEEYFLDLIIFEDIILPEQLLRPSTHTAAKSGSHYPSQPLTKSKA